MPNNYPNLPPNESLEESRLKAKRVQLYIWAAGGVVLLLGLLFMVSALYLLFMIGKQTNALARFGMPSSETQVVGGDSAKATTPMASPSDGQAKTVEPTSEPQSAAEPRSEPLAPPATPPATPEPAAGKSNSAPENGAKEKESEKTEEKRMPVSDQDPFKESPSDKDDPFRDKDGNAAGGGSDDPFGGESDDPLSGEGEERESKTPSQSGEKVPAARGNEFVIPLPEIVGGTDRQLLNVVQAFPNSRVMINLDATGSMQTSRDAVAAVLPEILGEIQGGTIGVSIFRDATLGEVNQVIIPPTPRPKSPRQAQLMVERVRSITLDGGGDHEETGYQLVIWNMRHQPRGTKECPNIEFIITDSDEKQPELMGEMRELMKMTNTRVFVIHVFFDEATRGEIK